MLLSKIQVFAKRYTTADQRGAVKHLEIQTVLHVLYPDGPTECPLLKPFKKNRK